MTQTDKVLVKANAIQPSMTIEGLIQKSCEELGKALPSHMRPERIVRIAMTTLRMNPKLYKCDPMSFLGALFQSAQLGLEPNIEGQAYIIPYNVKGVMMAQFQIGYKGYVELFWRHQASVSLSMETVYENDSFDFDLGEMKLSHKPLLKGDRGAPYAYYAVAHMANGGRAMKVMTFDDVLSHAKRFSKCYDKEKQEFFYGTPWRDHFDSMAKKTCMIQLMRLLPKSIEIQQAIAMDETIKTKIAPNMFEIPKAVEHDEISDAVSGESSPAKNDNAGGGELSDKEKKDIEAAEKAQADLDKRKKAAREPGSEG